MIDLWQNLVEEVKKNPPTNNPVNSRLTPWKWNITSQKPLFSVVNWALGKKIENYYPSSIIHSSNQKIFIWCLPYAEYAIQLAV